MKYILFILLSCVAFAQNNGIRSLNGSLNNSQRLTIDTTSSATFKWTISNGVHTVYIPYRIASMTSGGGSVGNADSLGGLPASYYLLKSDTAKIYAGYGLLKDSSSHTVTLRADSSILVNKAGTQVISASKYFTAPQYFRDSVYINGKVIIGNSNKNVNNYNSLIVGQQDSILTTSSYGQGQNYIFGRLNTIGRVNTGNIGGNWLFGQYLRSENLGLWAFGSDDDFQKKIIPFEGATVFVNENVIHWGSNSMSSIYAGMPVSYAIQSPHVKDSLMFNFFYQKYGSASDDTGWGALHYELRRGFTRTLLSNGETQKIDYGTNSKRIYSINQFDDDALHFNSRNTSGRPFAPVYIDSNDLIVQLGDVIATAGYLDGDSLRRNGSTVLTGTWHSGLSASALGNITTGTINAQTNSISGGAISGTSVTGTTTLTMGGNSALTHAIRSSSFPPLFVTRTTNSATASAGSIALSGWNSANAEVEYAMIGSQVVLNTAGIHSGHLLGRIFRGGTRYIAWWVDTLQRFSIVGDGRTSPLSTTATFSVKNNNFSANIMELYRYGSASTVLSADSLGAFRTVGGTSTSGAYGVAPIVDTITYGAVSSSIASRNLPSTAGTYRISYFMAVNTAGTGGTVQATISYNNGVARTLTSASLLLTLTTEADNNAFIYKVTSGTPTIAVTVTGGSGSYVYSFDAVVERLK